MENKQQWPELVGKTGEEAKQQINLEYGDINVVVMKVGSPCTKDLRMNRVRVFVGEDGKVAEVPRRG